VSGTRTAPPLPTGSPARALLRSRLDLVQPALDAASAQLWRAEGLAARYRVYLRVMYDVTRASVPLMERAARLCAQVEGQDAVAAPLLRYLESHAREEFGHDDWVRDDLAELGDTHFPDSLPSITVARLVGAQYYWMEHHHPVSVLGYIAVMESAAPRSGVAGWIADTADVPDAALRTVREHADLDGGHTAAVLHLLDSLPLSAAQSQAAAVSGMHTAHGLIALYEHISQLTEAREDTR
jgi:hypothetical protein